MCTVKIHIQALRCFPSSKTGTVHCGDSEDLGRTSLLVTMALRYAPSALPPKPVFKSLFEVGMLAQSCCYLLNCSRLVSVFKLPLCLSLKQ